MNKQFSLIQKMQLITIKQVGLIDNNVKDMFLVTHNKRLGKFNV